MNEQTKREKLRRYFSKSHPVLAFGFLLLVIAGLALALHPALGLLIAAIGGLWLVVKALRRGRHARDQEVDKWLDEDKERIAERSLDKLGIDAKQVARTLTIAGPILWETDGVPRKDILWKKGKDGTLRFSVYNVTVIQLTNQMLAAYVCDFNSLKNKIVNEETYEFYYRDIVSVATAELSDTSKLRHGKKELVRVQAFRLSVVNGEGIEVAISFQELAEKTGGTIPTSDAENAVRMIRTMLRDKK